MTAFQGHRAVDPVIRFRLFGPVEVLSFSGDSVLPRGRKAQAILCHLALSPEGTASRQRLVDLLWSGRWPEQGRASLRQSLLEIRAALGERHGNIIVIERDRISLDRTRLWIDGLSKRHDDDRIDPANASTPHVEHLLETLTGIDPKFDAWVAAVRAELADALALSAGTASRAARIAADDESRATDADGARETQPARNGGLVLAVAPLLQIGAEPIDDYVAPALTQEIVTALARFRWIQVRLSHAPATCDADYRLEGYVSRIADGCRVVARLIDQTDRGIIVWTGSVHTAYPLQYAAIGDVVERVVEQIDPEILAIETRKILRRPAASHDSYEYVLRAIPLLYRFAAEPWRSAIELLDRAVAIDPGHGRAYAFSALCRVTGLAHGWSCDRDGDLRTLDRHAAHAITCDPRDSLALALGAHIKAFLHHDFAAALALFERAIHANPSCGFAWGYSSLTFAYLGQTDEAARRLTRSQAIMIHDPFSSFLDGFRAVITYFAGDWPETIAVCRRQLDQRPGLSNIRKLLIGALCFAGRFDEARLEERGLLLAEPDFSWSGYLTSYPFGRARDRTALRAVLCLGGLMVDPAPAGAGRVATVRLPATPVIIERSSSGSLETYQ